MYDFLPILIKKLCSHMTTQLICGSATASQYIALSEHAGPLPEPAMVQAVRVETMGLIEECIYVGSKWAISAGFPDTSKPL